QQGSTRKGACAANGSIKRIKKIHAFSTDFNWLPDTFRHQEAEAKIARIRADFRLERVVTLVLLGVSYLEWKGLSQRFYAKQVSDRLPVFGETSLAGNSNAAHSTLSPTADI